MIAKDSKCIATKARKAMTGDARREGSKRPQRALLKIGCHDPLRAVANPPGTADLSRAALRGSGAPPPGTV